MPRATSCCALPATTITASTARIGIQPKRHAAKPGRRQEKAGRWVPIYRDECSKAETPADTGRKRFACSGATNRLLCMTCTKKIYNAAMKAKKAAKDGVGSGT
ncbi:hypothetical protein V501_09399 [Pseudogymnoascus sp. VKM F-4519 (FW-2642)]|nr:hypothetical protein V501_09399 [Pseudogymnoascus sp. VKM F-4519 (FW-2642)]